MKTGMVILNYNDYENTIKMIEQIKDYSCLSKIIIVDNCSTDESVSKITPFLNKKIILIEAKKNKGYAAGNNLGLKYLANETNCEFAIISNPDIVVEESVILEMIKDMKKDEKISFLGPKILENGHITKGWKLPSYACELKDMKKIKYFDEGTFLYYEENILAKKAKDKGLKSYVDTKLSINHKQSLSVNKSLKKIGKYKNLKKSMFYYEKNYNRIGFLKLFILKLFYHISVFFAYLTFWI